MNMSRTVLITGGAGGIGLAAAQRFVGEGSHVILVDLDLRALERARSILVRDGGRADIVECDVAAHAAVHGAARDVLDRYGAVEVLVNNAGISQPKGVLELDEAEWERTLAVNLKGAFNWCQALLPAMLKTGRGKIVNVASMSAKMGGGPGTISRACYAASKAGLLGFTRGLAREVAPAVTVNAVCPGLIDTPMTRAFIARAGDEIAAGIPLGRLGTADDVAGVIVFLASPAAAWITGEVVDCNGGTYID
jgi:NAD(P)-dependent dehydrogenase (short-subunit alcohol dehydrogenase family)